MKGYLFIVINNKITNKRQRYKIYTDNLEDKIKEYDNKDSGLICVDRNTYTYIPAIEYNRGVKYE